MPLTPDEIRQKQQAMNTPVVQKLIAEIDAAMVKGFDGTRFFFNNVPRLEDHGAVKRAVFSIYAAKGWDVKETCDQREGTWWTFTPKEEV